MENSTEMMHIDLEPHRQLLYIQQVSFKCCIFDNGEHVYCVNMDLHFILQVFKVIELKLGPHLKDLINALSGRLLILCYTFLTHIWPLLVKHSAFKYSAGFPALI